MRKSKITILLGPFTLSKSLDYIVSVSRPSLFP